MERKFTTKLNPLFWVVDNKFVTHFCNGMSMQVDYSGNASELVQTLSGCTEDCIDIFDNDLKDSISAIVKPYVIAHLTGKEVVASEVDDSRIKGAEKLPYTAKILIEENNDVFIVNVKFAPGIHAGLDLDTETVHKMVQDGEMDQFAEYADVNVTTDMNKFAAFINENSDMIQKYNEDTFTESSALVRKMSRMI